MAAKLKRTLAEKTAALKVGEKVRVSGWASTVRDHGSLIFIDLRDWSGVVQITIDEKHKEAFDTAKLVGLEYVIEVEGEIVQRAQEVVNKNLTTGQIEIKATSVKILNKSKVLPFPLSDDGRDIDENLRLKYRYIDIRRKRMRDLIQLRDNFLLYTRNWFNSHGFTHVETPLLTVSSPEGARDFLVPSRLYPGKFFALPQAPQQYKQLLMVGGVNKYFQIAPCFRDEDPRADRHSGAFYQIDVECSFIEQQEFFEEMEPYFKDVSEALTDKKVKEFPFPQIPYLTALDKYGSDKPDLRFDMIITDVTKEFHNSSMDIFKTVETAKAIIVDREFSRSEIDQWTEKTKQQGAKGLAWFKVLEGKLDGSLVKFFSESDQESILSSLKSEGYSVKGSQTIFVIAGEKISTQKQMGWLRNQMGELMNLKDPKVLAYAWIVDFPMFEWSETEKRWDFCHNPFSMPQGGIEALTTKKPDEIYANQYDIACNGLELSSGSIRNYNPETFIEAFKICGYSEEETRSKFGHMISAFEFGAPPHGGFAPGVDRLMMVLFDEINIREVYAFPQTNGQELMTNAPREISADDLKLYNLQFTDKGDEVLSKIVTKLEKSEIKYKLVEHKEARTSEEAAEIRGTKLSDGAKALVLHSKEYYSKYIMVVIPADKELDISKVEAATGEQFEIAKAEEVEKWTGLKLGAIPPFGRLLGMEIYLDKSWWSKENAAFNAGRRDRSILIEAADLIKAIEPNKISQTSDFIR
jgi:aspartyl-tRNA synthetase